MNEPPPNKLFLFLLPLLFCACSDDALDLARINSSLVLDFADSESLPSQRLSVWAEVSSNVRRVESILVQNGEYSWRIDEPLLISEGQRQWAGYMRLEPSPLENSFVPGSYSVKITDAAGNTADGSFRLSYDMELSEKNAAFASEKLSAAVSRVAVYSESGDLLYFAKGEPSWYTDSDIFRAYKDADFFRRVISGGGVVCLLPKTYRDGDKSDVAQ